MKRFVFAVMLMVMVMTCGMSASASTRQMRARVYNHYTEHHIRRDGSIKKYKCVRFITADGNIWGWRLEKGQKFRKGQKVTLLMDTTNKNFYRWEIKKVRIRG